MTLPTRFVDLDVTLRFPAAPDDEGVARLIEAAVAGNVAALAVAIDGATPQNAPSARAMEALVRAGADRGVTVVPAVEPLQERDGAYALTDVALADAELAALGVSCRVWRLRRPCADTLALRRVFDLAAARGALVIVNSLDAHLADGALAWEGVTATRLGLAAMPEAAEAIGVARVAALQRLTGARVHIAGVATAAGAAAVAAAAHHGVTGSVCASHLLADERVLLARPYDTRALRRPPLPLASSRAALVDAVRAGELIIASGHRHVRKRDRDLEPVHAGAGGTALARAAHALGAALGADIVARAYGAAPAALLGVERTARGDAPVVDRAVVDDDLAWLASVPL